MTKKRGVLLISTVLSLILWSNTLVSAATHTCGSDCCPTKEHTHIGEPTTKAGCYQGSYVNTPCGGTIEVTGQESYHPSGAPSYVTVTLFHLNCKKMSTVIYKRFYSSIMYFIKDNI